MLDAYYERYGLVNGERLVIPNGAYRVFLMPIYRNLEPPPTPAVEIIAGPGPQDQADPILALKSARRSAASAPPYRRPGIILAGVLSWIGRTNARTPVHNVLSTSRTLLEKK